MKVKHKRILGWSLAVALFTAAYISMSENGGYLNTAIALVVSIGFVGIVILCVILINSED